MYFRHLQAVDQYGQIIDVYVSAKRGTNAARRFFASAILAHGGRDAPFRTAIARARERPLAAHP